MSYYNLYPMLPKHINVSTLKTLSGENPALVSPSGLKIFCQDEVASLLYLSSLETLRSIQDVLSLFATSKIDCYGVLTSM